MISAFQQNIKNALAHRKQIAIPTFGKYLIAIALGTIALLAVAVVIAPENEPERYFVREGGMVTYISAVFLGLAAIFSGVCFKLSRGRTDFLRFFWLLTVVGFTFLFLDELLRFHESTGRWMTPSVDVPEGFRRWDDIIVILYGIVAVIAMAGFLPEILRYPRVAEMMAAAFTFYFIHTLIDATQEPRTTLSAILEESAKVFCAEYLAISMFIALLGIKAAAKLKGEKLNEASHSKR
ncbi:MAG: hypothetical protein NPINA01_32910 [Nitrospinaceae bacterium]|nr:MAG: hypothetical protein NPINA01_32910 [Nitrospinaceae bacterium]